MITIPITLEMPIIMDGVVIGHFPDIDCLAEFDTDGDLVRVGVIGTKIEVEKDDKGVNERALWTAATARVSADRHLRLEIDERLNGLEPYGNNSREAIRRELSPVFL